MTTPAITNTTAGFARGINKSVVIVGETTFGTAPAAGANIGQTLRRTSATFNLSTSLIQSQEITVSQQTEDARQGPRSVTGSIAGQLSCGTYSIIWESLLRANFAQVAPVTGVTDLVLVASGAGYNMTSASQTWATQGIFVGDTVRLSGLLSTFAPNNGVNLHVISASTQHTLQVSTAGSLVPMGSGAGQTVSVTVAGKRAYVPPTGQAIPSFTIEEWYGDVGLSDVSTGLRCTQCAFNIPASGYATFQASFTGQNQVEDGTQMYTAALPESTTLGLTAVGGEVTYKGAAIAYITSMNLNVSSATSADPVVGSNLVPDILLGRLSASGSFSCYMMADSMTADFLNEVELDISMIMTDQVGNPAANFIRIYLPRVKLASQSKTDRDTGISRSFNFTAMRNLSDATKLLTTMSMQDTLA